jgi:16S rRNA (adenine1518-N6/adenine1519-N6)-dimethyltransferase
MNSLDPAHPDQLGRLLERHGIRAKHRLGQNFLVDPALRDRIVEAVGLRPDDEVFEVGAGTGTLTVELARRCRRLVAVELDRRLVHALRSVTRGAGSVEILESDVLQVDTRELFPAGGQVVVGNIPYYLTGALLPRLLEPEPRPRRLALVVQKEVAERWTQAGDWSLASVAVQVFAQPELALTLPSSAFQPAPKVDSALVVMEVRPRPLVDEAELAAFFGFVGTIFQSRRKQLGGTLARLAGIAAAEAVERLGALGLAPDCRPQTLTVPQWLALHRSLAGRTSHAKTDREGPG